MSGLTSVIIPCFNADKYLPAALDSVRRQTTPAREVIVIDDGSEVPVAAPPGWDGPPLRIIRTPNRGLARARNRGIDEAAGTFVAFLDADDMWHPEKLGRQEQALLGDAGAVASYTRCFEEPGFFGFGPYPPADVPQDEVVLVLWHHFFFPPSTLLARRDAVLAAGKFNEHLPISGEDVELYFRLLALGRFVQVPAPLCWYRQHPGQLTQKAGNKLNWTRAARREMIRLHADRLVQAGIPPHRLWDAYRSELLALYYRRHFSPVRPFLWAFWKEHPRDWRMLAYALLSLVPASLFRRLEDRPAAGPGAPAPKKVPRLMPWPEVVAQIRRNLAR